MEERNKDFVYQVKTSDTDKRTAWDAYLHLATKLLANTSFSPTLLLGTLAGFQTKENKQEKVDLVKQQFSLLRELSDAEIDPQIFDLFMSNEVDRQLKRRFGLWFFGATVSFTLLSYLIIVLNSVLNWGINQTAIMALIIETPIQFIGLLYIIARNLFPQSVRTQGTNRLSARHVGEWRAGSEKTTPSREVVRMARPSTEEAS